MQFYAVYDHAHLTTWNCKSMQFYAVYKQMGLYNRLKLQIHAVLCSLWPMQLYNNLKTQIYAVYAVYDHMRLYNR